MTENPFTALADDLHRLVAGVEAASAALATEVRSLAREQARKVEALQAVSVSERRYQRLFQITAITLLFVLVIGVIVAVNVQRDSRRNNAAVRDCTTPDKACYEQVMAHTVIINWCSQHTGTLAATQACVRNVRTHPLVLPTAGPTTGAPPTAPTATSTKTLIKR